MMAQFKMSRLHGELRSGTTSNRKWWIRLEEEEYNGFTCTTRECCCEISAIEQANAIAKALGADLVMRTS